MQPAQKPQYPSKQKQPRQQTAPGTQVGPHDERAERTVLGTILERGEDGHGTEAFRLTQTIGLEWRDFAISHHQRVMTAIQVLDKEHAAIDLVTVSSKLATMTAGGKSFLDIIGGEPFLRTLMDAAGMNLQSYIEIVRKHRIRRDGKLAIQNMNAILDDGALSLDELSAGMTREVKTVDRAVRAVTDRNTFDMGEMLPDYVAEIIRDSNNPNYTSGVNTGFDYLDKYLLGWRKGMLYTLAAPSGWGKSAFSICTSMASLKDGKSVLFLSTEMNERQIADRLLSAWTEIEATRLQVRTNLRDFEKQRLVEAANQIAQIHKTNAFKVAFWQRQPSMAQIESKIDEYRFDTDLVVVDWIGHTQISDPDNASRGSEKGVIDHAYMELDRITAEYNLPVLTGMQINRMSQSKGGKIRKFVQNDLYGSSVPQQLSDVIMFLWQPKEVQKVVEVDGRAEMLIRKNRSGPNPADQRVFMRWNPDCTLFDNWRMKDGSVVEATMGDDDEFVDNL